MRIKNVESLVWYLFMDYFYGTNFDLIYRSETSSDNSDTRNNYAHNICLHTFPHCPVSADEIVQTLISGMKANQFDKEDEFLQKLFRDVNFVTKRQR